MTTLPTVTAADLLARNPCADWPARILVLCAHYRRERWGALEILSVDAAIAEDRLWVCLHDSLVPEPVLVRFACEVASDALRTTGLTDQRSWDALTARLAFARGEIGADELDAARDAAWDAARATARDAARAAARAAARDAARAAAWDAARDAAWAAARDAAWAAARAAARAAQVITLRTLLLLHADGYDVLRGDLGKPITERRAA